MKNRVIGFVALLLFFQVAAANDFPTFRGDQRIVGTYYFYWHDWNTSLHIYEQGKDALTHHPPDIQSFSFANVGWHRRELSDMMESGIDFLLPVYWGDRTNTRWALGGIDKLVEAELSLINEGYDPPKIGMFYDTTALMVEHHVSGHPDDKPNLTTEDGKELFYGMIHDFYSRVPPRLWARIDSAAIVWLYSSGWVKDYDQSLVSYVKERFAEDFNSTVFIIRERSWKLETDMEYGWGAALGPVLRDVSAIGPGFNNEGAVRCYGQSSLNRDRLGGLAYTEDWERALRAGSNIVVIETWNELHEGTEICETDELGRLYIQITANYSRIFKEDSWNHDLKEMDSLIVFEPEALQGSPGQEIELNITLVNKGYLSWSERLDLGIFWLNLDARNHSYNEVITIDFAGRLTPGQRHEEIVNLTLPKNPGIYRVLISTSYLGKRPELVAVVPDSSIFFVVCSTLLAIILAGRSAHT